MKSFALSFLLASALFVTAQPDSGSAASGDPVVSVQSGEWMTPSTWDCNCVPALGNEVSILNGHSIVLAEGDTAQAEGLSVSEGAVLDLPRESRLELTSSFASNGEVLGTGKLVFTGAESHSFGPGELYHVSCEQGEVLVLDTVRILGQFDAGNALVQTFGKLVLVNHAGIFKGGGNIEGLVTRQRQYEKLHDTWIEMFAPSLAGEDADVFLSLQGASYVKQWVEPVTGHLQLTPEDDLEMGTGYLCLIPSGQHEIIESGEAVTEASISLSAESEHPLFGGWNLIGNPLSSPIDISQHNSVNPLGATYHWVDSLNTYIAQVRGLGTFGHAGYFEPGAAFWTIVDSSFSLEFDSAAVVDHQTFIHQRRPEAEPSVQLLVASEQSVEQCVIGFGEGSTGYDPTEDAKWLLSYSGPNNLDFYSISSDGEPLMVNRTTTDEGLVIPLNVSAPNGVELSLSIPEHPTNICLTIEDVITGWTSPVDAALNYSFVSNGNQHRFNLILGGGIEASSADAACASAMNGSITVMGPDEASTFTLVDAEGNAAGTFSPDSAGGTFTDLAVGTYLVTAHSEGCADLTRTIEVGAGGSGIAPFAIDAMPDHIGCYDDHGGVTLEVEGGLEPYSVNWSHGGTGLTIEVEEAGVLHALVTDAAGCSDSTTVEVLAAPQVAAGIDLDNPVVALINGEAEVHFENASTGATGYQWNFGDGGTSTTENPIHAYTAAGAYTVGLNAWNDYCSDTYQMVVTVETVSSVGDFISAIEPSIHRTAQGWEVAHTQEAFHVEVFDLTGRIVHQAQGMTGQPVLLDPAVMPTVSLVHWVGALTGQQKTWRVAH